ncbi:MAG: hypothetical protein IKT40_08850 [Bacilli bacterium]|nr:hypothetical protein [Bacilli bacterium]
MRIEPQYIKAYFDESLGGRNNPTTEAVKVDDFFTVGDKYTIQGDECDGFSMSSKLYELVGKCDQLYGIDVNAVIMKQLSGDKSSLIFSLTKDDCKSLGVNFERGLQVFSKNLSWKKIEENKKEEKVEKKYKFFDPQDLSTYPMDQSTKKINSICVKIGGFVPNSSISINDIKKCITITTNHTSGNNVSFDYRILTKYITLGRCEVFDNMGNLFTEISLSSVYGRNGLEPSRLKDLNINNLIKVELHENR